MLRFSSGRIVATPGALEAIETAGVDAVRLFARHATGDWGSVDTDDWAANERAVENGERVISSHPIGRSKRLWVITEADRSVTAILLPSESILLPSEY